jgi:phospholipid:diacylglycerol acyltransferase
MSDVQDDPEGATDTHGRFLSFRHPDVSAEASNLTSASVSPNMTMEESSPYILTHTPSSFQRMISTNYSYGFETDVEQLKANDRDHRKASGPPVTLAELTTVDEPA